MLTLILAATMVTQQVGEPEVGNGFFGCPANMQLQLAIDPRESGPQTADVARRTTRYAVRCVSRRNDGPALCPGRQTPTVQPGRDRCPAVSNPGDGNSNTVAIGETPATAPRDGTSNTVLVGETPSAAPTCPAGQTLMIDTQGHVDRCGLQRTGNALTPIAQPLPVLRRITAKPAFPVN